MRIIDFSDNYLILYFYNSTLVGLYAPVYTLGMVGIMVFVNSFRLAWHPFFLSEQDNPDASNIFSKVTTWYAVFIGTVFLGIFLFRKEIFHVYAPSFPRELASLIPFISFAYVLYGFYIIMLAGVFIREKTKYLPLAPLTGAALNLGLNFVFIPVYGIAGAVFTTVIAYLAMVTILFVISRRVYRIRYEYGRIGRVLLTVGGAAAISLAVDIGHTALRLLFNGAVFCIPLLLYWYGGFLLPAEKSRIHEILRKRSLK